MLNRWILGLMGFAPVLSSCSATGDPGSLAPGTSGGGNAGSDVTSNSGGAAAGSGVSIGSGGGSGTAGAGGASGATGSGGTGGVALAQGCILGRQGCPCASSNPGICEPGLTCTAQNTCCNGSDCSMPAGPPPSVTSTCVAGQKGCLCDSRGACESGLACTSQTAPNPKLCCSGADCAPATASIGGTCGDTSAPSTCTPGVTIPPATDSNDNCGYPASGFNESSILCGITASGGGSQPGVIDVFYSDEHAMPLGCSTSTYPVTPLTSNPQAAYYPKTGDPACVDTSGRPLRPVLFITDITADTTCTSGDQQKSGTAYDPVAIFGTWKDGTEGAGNVGTPNTTDPSPANSWTLGTGSDPVPNAVTNACPASGGGGRGFGGGGRGGSWGAELRFEVGLISGHSYRLQVMVHDGDQTRGADSGEACAVFCAGTGVSPCPNGQCG